jgi:polar amino acid transport system permease protein
MSMVLFEQFLAVGKGLSVTLPLFIVSLGIGAVLGLSIAILRKDNQIARYIIDRIISILRGTPVILQLSFVYFILASLGMTVGIFWAGVITLGINSAAYIGEIFRSGIDVLPKGQFEASKVLGISSFAMWKDIAIPQVLRNVWSALVNESIALLKETALISTIGGLDLFKCAKHIGATHFTYFAPLLMAGCYYYGIVLCIEYAGRLFEKRCFSW